MLKTNENATTTATTEKKEAYREIISAWASQAPLHEIRDKDGNLKRIDADISLKLANDETLWRVHYTDGTSEEAENPSRTVIKLDDFSAISTSDSKETPKTAVKKAVVTFGRAIESLELKSSRKDKKPAIEALRNAIELIVHHAGINSDKITVNQRELDEVLKTVFEALHEGYKLEGTNKLLNTVCKVIYRQLKDVSFKFVVSAQTAKAWEKEAEQVEQARQSEGVKLEKPAESEKPAETETK